VTPPRVAVPVPGTHEAAVVVPAPSKGPGAWAGAPATALDADGSIVLAYRLRDLARRGGQTIVARSSDGVDATTVAILDKDRFGAESLERPAIVRTDDGRWRLYVCCATPGSKHWRIDILEADDPAGFSQAPARTVFAGDERTAVKDPIIRRTESGWEGWICCHPLDEPGEEDRMTTAYVTSDDGLAWDWHGTVLRGRAGAWDSRGARLPSVLANGYATYDGRASKEENFRERTGVAHVGRDGSMQPVGSAPIADVRYLDVLELPAGGSRLYYEAPLADGSHELRTELSPGA
jgi:hypothetical protein